jgi:hypothetical protein
MLTLSLSQTALPLPGLENLHRWEQGWEPLLYIVTIVLGMGSHLRVKMATAGFPAWSAHWQENRSEDSGMARSTLPSGLFSRWPNTSHGRSRPSRMRNAAFFTNGPVALCLEYQPTGPLEKILGAPQNPLHAAICSKRLLMADRCTYCMGLVRSDSGAPELVALLLTCTWIAQGGRKKNSSVYVAILPGREKGSERARLDY